MADPFEEFEFKPLTEGLGFHQKAERIKEQIAATDLSFGRASTAQKANVNSEISNSLQDLVAPTINKKNDLSFLSDQDSLALSRVSGESRPFVDSNSQRQTHDFAASENISDLIDSLPPSFDFLDESSVSAESRSLSSQFLKPTETDLVFEEVQNDRPQIFQPLGRESYQTPSLDQTLGHILPKENGNPSVPTPVAPVPMSPSPYREKLNESYAKAFPHAEKPKVTEVKKEVALELQPVAAHWGAGFLDAMVVAGISTLLLVCILAITHVNLLGMLSHAKTNGATRIHLALLFMAVLHMYLLTARSFFGVSLGEWAFELQLGTEKQQKSMFFPLLVAWRMLINMITGLVVLPFLSMIVRRDLAKYLTGLQLYRRP